MTMAIFKKLRGVVGTGITWALAWTAIGTVLHFIFKAVGLWGFLGLTLVEDLVITSAMGFISGATFAGGLLLTERRQGLDGIRVSRGALWGMFAGIVGPLLWLSAGVGIPWLALKDIWLLFVGMSLFGGASGAAMTSVAKSANDRLIHGFSDDARGVVDR